MDLAQFVANNSYLRLFNAEQDESLIQDFMSSSPMRVGGLQLVYDRSPEFQSLLRAQSDKFITLLAHHNSGELLGMFSLCFGTKYINREKVSCAYIGDFRTDNSRASTKLWRQDYAKIIEAIKNDPRYGHPKYILTAVLEKNKEAIRSLAQSKRDFGFCYDPLCTVQMVNVFAVLPGIGGRQQIKVESACQEDEVDLREFLAQSESNKQFGALMKGSNSDWSWRQQSWQRFSVENFLIIRGANGKIMACTLPWNPSHLKRMRVLAAPRWMDRGFKILNDFGLNLPAVGDSLETVYLTHLCIAPELNTQKILYAFLINAKKLHPKAHMISFADFGGVSQRMNRLLAQRVGVCLFNVRMSNEEKLAQSDNLSFEMALV